MKTKNWLLSFGIGLSLCSSSLVFAEGSGHSGGGEGVIFPDGTVKFVDLLGSSPLPGTPVTDEFIREQFFPKSNRFVSALGTSDQHFFDCAVTKLTATNIPELVAFAPLLKTVPVVQIEARLEKWTAGENAPKSFNASYASVSSSIPAEFQEPLAAFNTGLLWISKRFASRLSENDACGLSVHEALRAFSYSQNPVAALNTSKIEDLTRKIMINSPELKNTSFQTASEHQEEARLAQRKSWFENIRIAVEKYEKDNASALAPAFKPAFDNAFTKATQNVNDDNAQNALEDVIDNALQDPRISVPAQEDLEDTSLAFQSLENENIIATEQYMIDQLNGKNDLGWQRLAEFGNESPDFALWVNLFDGDVTAKLPRYKKWDAYLGKIVTNQLKRVF
jgi:hypothetical protein